MGLKKILREIYVVSSMVAFFVIKRKINQILTGLIKKIKSSDTKDVFQILNLSIP